MVYHLAANENKHKHSLYFQIKCDISTLNGKVTAFRRKFVKQITSSDLLVGTSLVELTSNKVGIYEPNFNKNPCLISS